MRLKPKTLDGQIYRGLAFDYEEGSLPRLEERYIPLSPGSQQPLGALGTLWHFCLSLFYHLANPQSPTSPLGQNSDCAVGLYPAVVLVFKEI